MSEADAALSALKPVFHSLERAHVVYLTHVAATCVFVYDHLTTLADEVDIIWRTRWNAGKVLFLIARYITWPELFFTLFIEFVNESPRFCHNVLAYGSWSTMLSFVTTGAILILRTWALWGGSRPVFISLTLLLVAIIAANAVLVVYYIDHTVFVRASELIPILKGCVIAQSTDRVGIFYSLHTAFEVVIVILTLIPGIQHFRFGRSNLISSLYRDGILYFVYLFALSLGNLLAIYIAPSEYVVLLSVMQRSFHAILSCKIILHLQSASRAPTLPTGTDTLTMPMSAAGISFVKFGGAGQSIMTRPGSEWFGALSHTEHEHEDGREGRVMTAP